MLELAGPRKASSDRPPEQWLRSSYGSLHYPPHSALPPPCTSRVMLQLSHLNALRPGRAHHPSTAGDAAPLWPQPESSKLGG